MILYYIILCHAYGPEKDLKSTRKYMKVPLLLPSEERKKARKKKQKEKDQYLAYLSFFSFPFSFSSLFFDIHNWLYILLFIFNF